MPIKLGGGGDALLVNMLKGVRGDSNLVKRSKDNMGGVKRSKVNRGESKLSRGQTS